MGNMKIMSKRFVDTDMWRKAWFRSLSPKMKAIWLFLITNCDRCGIIEVDLQYMGFMVGDNVEYEELVDDLGDKIYDIGDNKWFIPKFIKHQYGELNESCKPHIPVIKRLIDYGLVTDSLLIDYDRLSIDYHLLSVPFKKKTISNININKKNISIDNIDSIDNLKKRKVIKEKKEDLVSLKSLNKEYLTLQAEKFKKIDVVSEFEKFEDFIKSTGRTYKDYRAAFRNWCRNATAWLKGTGSDNWAKEMRERYRK